MFPDPLADFLAVGTRRLVYDHDRLAVRSQQQLQALWSISDIKSFFEDLFRLTVLLCQIAVIKIQITDMRAFVSG